jgi:hypothetical protein
MCFGLQFGLSSGGVKGTFLKFPQDLSNLYGFTFIFGSLNEFPSPGRGYFDRDFVCLELDECFSAGDRFAFLLQPVGHRRFDDRFTERRDLEGYHRDSGSESICMGVFSTVSARQRDSSLNITLEVFGASTHDIGARVTRRAPAPR